MIGPSDQCPFRGKGGAEGTKGGAFPRAKRGCMVFMPAVYRNHLENRKTGLTAEEIHPSAFGISPRGQCYSVKRQNILSSPSGSCPEGLCKRTGFLGVKRRENPVRRHFERSEMRGQHYGVSHIVRWPLACPYCLRHFPRRGKQVVAALTISLT